MNDNVDMSDAGNETGFGDEGHETAAWQETPDEGLTGEEDGVFLDEEASADEALEDEAEGEEQVRPRAADWQGEAVIGALEARMNSFEEQAPDFEDALIYLAQKRNRELAAYAVVEPRLRDEALRARQMKIELGQIVAAALHRGENPADAIYTFARGYGFDAGKAAGGRMTLPKLAAMSEQDFGCWYEKNSKTFRRLMGG